MAPRGGMGGMGSRGGMGGMGGRPYGAGMGPEGKWGHDLYNPTGIPGATADMQYKTQGTSTKL